MLNFDKDQKLLFQCRPFSNQWPAVLGNIIQAGVALLPERVEHRMSWAADFHRRSVTVATFLHANEFSPTAGSRGHSAVSASSGNPPTLATENIPPLLFKYFPTSDLTDGTHQHPLLYCSQPLLTDTHTQTDRLSDEFSTICVLFCS